MYLVNFSASGWQSWELAHPPLIRDQMPVLVDDDLLFEDAPGRPRATVSVNRWLRELPLNGAPAVRTWRNSAVGLREWMEFIRGLGIELLGEREDLRGGLGKYAEYRLAGELANRWDATTWNLNVGILSNFYAWARDEGLSPATPFSFRAGRRMADGVLLEVERNMAKLRTPKRHTTIKYLERDFAELFVRALSGLGPDGEPDATFRGREGARNAAMARLVVSSGLRRQEFTHLTVYEVPALPPRPRRLPVLFPLSHAITKGQKARTTWIGYDALAAMHQYLELDRAASADGFRWRPPAKLGEALVIEEPDWEGARINGERRSWRKLRPAERLRLVAPDGSSPLVGLQSGGRPFVDWATVFARTSARIRERFEPRFPTVGPHRLRHTMAMATLEWLVSGYYQRAVALAADTGDDAAMALYLTRHDPVLILRDLLGHQSVLSTELYISRLDVTRIYRDAYLAGLGADPAAEAASEFDDELVD
jgi:integrase